MNQDGGWVGADQGWVRLQAAPPSPLLYHRVIERERISGGWWGYVRADGTCGVHLLRRRPTPTGLSRETELRATFGRLWRAVEAQQPSPCAVIGLTYLLLGGLGPEPASRPCERPVSEAIEEAVCIVETSYSRDISTDGLPDIVGLARTRFFSSFKARTGCSPAAYLTGVRMRNAEALLQQGLSVDYVARSVGYEDPHYFSRIFRKVHGTSPTAFTRSGR